MSDILDFKRDGILPFDITLNSGELEVVGKFIYLGVKFSKDVSGKAKVESTVLQRKKN